MDSPPKLGHSLIDAQHADLCHCIGMLKALAAKQHRRQQIENILGTLAQMLRQHFETEEAVMFDIGLPSELFLAHCEEHRKILAELELLHAAGAECVGYDLADVSRRVSVWVDSHLTHFDREMVPYLRGDTALV